MGGEKKHQIWKGCFSGTRDDSQDLPSFIILFVPRKVTRSSLLDFYPASRQYKTHTLPRELLSFQNLSSIFLLLMEEILHHLAYIKPYKEWAFNYLSLNLWTQDFWTINSLTSKSPPENTNEKNPSAPSTRALLTYPLPACRPPPRRRSLPPFSWFRWKSRAWNPKNASVILLRKIYPTHSIHVWVYLPTCIVEIN